MKSKMGRVTSVNYDHGTVVVTYPETNTVSPELIVFQGRNKGKRRYNMPEIDEIGLCIIIDSSYEGIYIGSGVIDDVPLPSISGKGIDIYEYADGTKIMYDENTKVLTVDSVKDIVISSKELVRIEAPKIELLASEKITLNAPMIESSGEWQIIGSLIVSKIVEFTEGLKVKGISFLSHIHGGVQSGVSKTSKPE